MIKEENDIEIAVGKLLDDLNKAVENSMWDNVRANAIWLQPHLYKSVVYPLIYRNDSCDYVPNIEDARPIIMGMRIRSIKMPEDISFVMLHEDTQEQTYDELKKENEYLKEKLKKLSELLEE